ncbi:MAG: aspartate aminotransferase family protein [Thermodesulfobacteriota bacterium]|nr:aspartate aminotransferase family protein [Thermodesulfobacteriota bacterium]
MNNTFEQLKTRDEKSVCHTYGRYPLAAARAKGTRIYDPQGREYTDLLAGVAVVSLGHCRPELTQVMAEQAQKLIHVSNLLYQGEQVVCAEKLLSTCEANKVFFCNSGAEANEAAIKFARRYMQKIKNRDAFEIITLEGSFHGRTLATLAATGQDSLKQGFSPMPEGFITVPFDDIQALENAISPKTAGVLVELVQGEAGVRPLAPEYVQAMARICRERDILCLVDEVQTGMCRTGKFWAHQHFDLKPDIFTSAKALANGLPIGAVLATDKVAKAFEPGTHGCTFGGGPVVCAVASKVMDIMLEQNMAEQAKDMGEFALSLFNNIKAEFPDKVCEVRGKGLMLAIELCFPGKDVWAALLDKGFVLNLTQGNVLRLLPPLITEKQDFTRFAQALREVLGG